jgi:curved DNA-binding protein CbpA
VSVATNQPLPDYYTVLQVHPDADFEVIEAAYRQLMKKHHPDVAGDDPRRIHAHHARAKQINEAYSVLRDYGRRRAYDCMRTMAGARRPPEASHWQPSASYAAPRSPTPRPPQSVSAESSAQTSPSVPEEPWKLASMPSSLVTLLSAGY